ncbi:MAG: tetratricopeptide repeat protein [Planctomycetes bacterium]|nr:tetratricopeptide repeat protein [Planctomycetota bacterium]
MHDPTHKRNRSPAAFTACFVVVTGVVAFAHWPALNAEAISFDDYHYVVENPLVMNPGWTSAGRFVSEVLAPSTVGGYYQPLNMISLMLDAAMGGSPTNLGPFHRTSLALHVLNTLLILLLLYQLFGSLAAATGVALLFGVHPLTVETIPWVGERKTLLASFFALCSIIAYVRYARGGAAARKWYAASLVCFLLALLSKPTTTMLPIAMLLLDAWPLQRFTKRTIIEKWPFAMLAVASGVVTYVSQAASYVQTPGQVGPWRIPLVICHNIIFYLWKMVWPTQLSSHYPFPEPMNLSHPMVLAGVIGTAVLLVILLLTRRRTPAPLIGWLIFFALIFPTLGVVGFTIVIASDKYAYLPGIGILMILAAGATTFLHPRRATSSVAPRSALFAILIVACAAAETRATRQYLAAWRTSETLYEHMIALAPRAATPHFGLGHCHQTKGRFDAARAEYTMALECDPRHVHARNNLALLLLDVGQFKEAADHLRTVLTITPDAPDVLSNLSLALASDGQTDEAIECCKKALAINPGELRALTNWGAALGIRGDADGAIAKFEEALKQNADFADARRNLAAALWRTGRLPEAAEQYKLLLHARPDDFDALQNMGRLLIVLNRLAEAQTALEMALRVRPGDEGTTQLLNELARRTNQSAPKS